MSEDLQNDKQFKDYAYVTKQDLVEVYKRFDKSLINNVCGSKDGENSDSPAEADSSESGDDLLFLIQAPHGSAIHIPSDQYNPSANNLNNQNQTDHHP